jgi:hypothetical protein
VTIAELDLLEYQAMVDKYTFRLLLVPEDQVSFAFALYEGDNLVYYHEVHGVRSVCRVGNVTL